MKAVRTAAVIGILTTATLLFTETTTVPARASDPVEITAGTTPEVEAAQVTGELEQFAEDSETPTVTSYEVRSTDSAPGSSGLAVATRFPIPEGCAPDSGSADLQCDIGTLVVEPVVLSPEGDHIEHEVVFTDTDVLVTAESTPAGSIFSMYVGEDAETVQVAADTFAWMIQADAVEGGAMTTSADAEGDWFEEDTTGEAGADEVGEDWLPDEDEFDVTPDEPIPAYGRPKQVKVPSNYVYCVVWVTARCKPKVLHDYCSWSPDSFGYALPPRGGTLKASFKGPCARHDLAIDSIRKKGITVTKKRQQRANADVKFRSHLRQNCGYTFHGVKAGRTKCYDRAAIYYSVVSSKTKTWNGK